MDHEGVAQFLEGQDESKVPGEQELQQTNLEAQQYSDWLILINRATKLAERLASQRDELARFLDGAEQKREQVSQNQLSREERLEWLPSLRDLQGTLQDGASAGLISPSGLRNMINDLVAVMDSDQDKRTAWVIADHCNQVLGSPTNALTLSDDQVDLLKRAVPMLINQLEQESSVEEGRRQTEREGLSQLDSDSRELEQLITKIVGELVELVEEVDKKETEMGAPPFVEDSNNAEDIYSSFLARIAWRRAQLKQDKLRQFLSKRELRRRALVTQIGTGWYILNPKEALADIGFKDLLTYRIPGVVVGVSAEELVFEQLPSALDIDGIVVNGVARDSTPEEEQHYRTAMGTPASFVQRISRQGGLR